MTTKKILSLILATVIALCIFAGCTPNEDIGNSNLEDIGNSNLEDNGPQYGGVLNLAWTGNGSDSLDPLYNTGWLTYIWATNVFATAAAMQTATLFPASATLNCPKTE